MEKLLNLLSVGLEVVLNVIMIIIKNVFAINLVKYTLFFLRVMNLKQKYK